MARLGKVVLGGAQVLDDACPDRAEGLTRTCPRGSSEQLGVCERSISLDGFGQASDWL